MNRQTILAGLLAVSALLISPSLILDAQTDWESWQGVLVGVIGVGFSVLFSALWAQSLEANERRDRSARRFKPF